MKPIKIFKGDDTNFNNSKFLTIKINTEMDLTGFKGIFKLCTFKQEQDMESKTMEIVIPHEVTALMLNGTHPGIFTLIDTKNRFKTITNTIPFYITSEIFTQEEDSVELPVPEGYPYEIIVDLGGATDYNNLQNKPVLNGFPLEGEMTYEKYNICPLTALQEVEKVLNEKASTVDVQNACNQLQEQITTNKNDIGDLGDQVSEIEAKIPEEASDKNPLADKGFVKSEIENAKSTIETDLTTVKNDLSDLGTQVSSIESKIPETSSSTNKLVDEALLASELAKKQDTGDYATKTDVNNVEDDLATVINQVGAQGESINDLTASVTDLSNNKADKTELENGLAEKQDIISDLETIRSGAALGATALQSVPSEYVTETELQSKGYATNTALNNVSDDLATVTNQVGAQGEAINELNSSVKNLSNNKADKADSLFGYGITDAYTKEEVNGLVSSAFHYKGSKASVLELPEEGNIVGDVWNVLDTGANYAWTGTEWDKLSETVDLSGYYTKEEVNNNFATKANLNEHVADINNPHSVTKAQVGLGNVDNTSDLDKPVSTATQIELNKKANIADLGTMASKSANDYATKQEAVSLYAPKSLETTVSELGETVEGLEELKDDAYTKDNLIAGNNITIEEVIPEGGIDQYTLACWHLDTNAFDAVSGQDLYRMGVGNATIDSTIYKFGTGSSSFTSNGLYNTYNWNLDSTKPFTIDYWARYRGYESVARFSFGSLQLYLTLLNNSRTAIRTKGSADSSEKIINADIVNPTQFEWYHIACTYNPNGKEVTFFFNGKKQGTANVSFSSDVENFNQFSYFWNHNIDELRISSGIRYTKDFTPQDEAYAVVESTGKYAINAIIEPYSLPIASSDTLGGIKPGTGVEVTSEGILNNTGYSSNDFTSDLKNKLEGVEEGATKILVDGTTITKTEEGVISATQGDKDINGIEGDYCAHYGITDCPNGILTVSGLTLTLKAGVVMQTAGSETLTTVASDMTHDIESETNFHLFYVQGGLLECQEVYWQEDEPESSANCVAWYNPTLEKWQFKSLDMGNVWTEASSATRIAFIKRNGSNVTRINYIGCRVLGTPSLDANVKVDNDTIVKDTDGTITAVGLKAKSDNVLYMWTGDEDEYKTGREDNTIPDTYFSIVDDEGPTSTSLSKVIGTVYASYSNSFDDNPGALPLFTGETIAKSIYPDFTAWLNEHEELQCTNEEYEQSLTTYGECAKFVVNTFSIRLPIIKNYIKSATETEGIKNIEAGLPDHTHYLATSITGGTWGGGEYLSKDGSTGGAASYTLMGTSNEIPSIFKSSEASNTVYGNSTTVTPASTTLYYWIVAYTDALPVGVAQVAQFNDAIATKVDLPTGKTQADVDFVVDSYSDDNGNWYRLYKSGYVAQGGYIASTATDYEKQTITFLKPFSKIYTLLLTPKSTYNNTMQVKGYAVSEITLESFATYPQRNGLTDGNYWRAEGQSAS